MVYERLPVIFVVVIAISLVSGSDDEIPTECPAVDPLDETIHLAHEWDCTKFYKCDHGKRVLFQCPLMDDEGNRLHFNPRLQVCDWPASAGCISGSTGTAWTTDGLNELTSPWTPTISQSTADSNHITVSSGRTTNYITSTENVENQTTSTGRTTTTDFNRTTTKTTTEPTTNDSTSTRRTVNIPTSTERITNDPTTPARTTWPYPTYPTEHTTNDSTSTKHTTDGPSTPGRTTNDPTTTRHTTDGPSTPRRTTNDQTTPEQTTNDPTTTRHTTDGPSTPRRTTNDRTTPEQTTNNPTTPERTTNDATTTERTTNDPTTPKHTTWPYSTYPTEHSTTYPTSTERTTSIPTSTERTTNDPTTPGHTTNDLTSTGRTTSNPTSIIQTTDNPTSTEGTATYQTTVDVPGTGIHSTPTTSILTSVTETSVISTETTERLTSQESSTATPSQLTEQSTMSTIGETSLTTGSSSVETTLTESTYAETTSSRKETTEPSTAATSGGTAPPTTPKPPSETKVPHETDCRFYYSIVDGRKILKQCPNGLHFSPTWLTCMQPAEAGCETSKPPPPPTCVPCGDIEHGSLVPHECLCDKYYKCSRGDLIVQQCPNGLHFNPRTGNCDYPASAGCVVPTREPDGEGKSTTLAIPSQCPQEGSIQFPHPSNCSLFYKCENGKKKLLECPNGLHYNPKAQMCDWPEYAGCEVSSESMKSNASIVYLKSLSCIGSCPATEPNPNKIAILPHENCAMFCKCHDGRAYEAKCPNNLLFDPGRLVCDSPHTVRCAETYLH